MNYFESESTLILCDMFIYFRLRCLRNTSSHDKGQPEKLKILTCLIMHIDGTIFLLQEALDILHDNIYWSWKVIYVPEMPCDGAQLFLHFSRLFPIYGPFLSRIYAPML